MAPKRPVPLGWELQLSRQWNILVYRNLITGKYQLEKPNGQVSLATDEVFSLRDEGPLRKRKPDGQVSLATDKGPEKRKLLRVAVRHVLIKHYKSEHTSMCRILSGEYATRSKQQACDYAKDVRSNIISKKITFQDAALDYSECRTAFRGGLLDPIFKRDDSDTEIKEAAFSLDVGEISQPVETSRGYHIIERIA